MKKRFKQREETSSSSSHSNTHKRINIFAITQQESNTGEREEIELDSYSIGVMERLPQEMVSNVLSRLTAKELMLCKCVCKLWFDLITDPQFISNYYIFYNNNRVREEKLLVVHSPDEFRYPINIFDADISIVSWNLNGPVSSQILNPPPDQLKVWHSITGPCNGIYLLQGMIEVNVIMNPSLRQFITLPKSHFTAPLGTHFRSCLKSPSRLGFDPKTNDYKVVELNNLCPDGTDEPKGDWTVALYSLNSNSWRNLGVNAIPFPVQIIDNSTSCTYVNNCCHWWGYVYEDKDEDQDEDQDEDVTDYVVLSFDMVTELFRTIKAPRMTQYSHWPWRATDPIAFTESSTIGLVVYPVCEGTDINFGFDVWMMKDYWDDESWIKQYSIGPLPDIYGELVGFYGSSSFLWKEANDRLVLHDPHREEQKRNLRACRSLKLRAAKYTESLISLHSGN